MDGTGKNVIVGKFAITYNDNALVVSYCGKSDSFETTDTARFPIEKLKTLGVGEEFKVSPLYQAPKDNLGEQSHLMSNSQADNRSLTTAQGVGVAAIVLGTLSSLTGTATAGAAYGMGLVATNSTLGTALAGTAAVANPVTAVCVIVGGALLAFGGSSQPQTDRV